MPAGKPGERKPGTVSFYQCLPPRHQAHGPNGPSLSVIILNFNGIDDTRLCLASLLGTTPEEVEILVWDNGSRRDEALLLDAAFGPRVRAFRSETNLGIAGGYNAAAKRARGELLIFLNNDTEVSAGWLSPLLEAMTRHPDVAVCQPKLRSWFDRSRFDYSGAGGGYLDRHGYPFARGRLFDSIEEDRGQYDEPAEIHWASAACMMVRRHLWDEVGGADERFFGYMEEIDICLRLRARGYRTLSVPQSVVYHKVAQSGGRQPVRKRFLEHRNNLLMLLKNMSLPQLALALPPRLALEWVSLFYYLTTGRFRYAAAALLAQLDLLRLGPRYLLERRPGLPAMPMVCRSLVSAFFLSRVRTYQELVR